ncbi:MAG: hypothetical protein M3176_14380 [Chloroflexota bacterium]|nr:hypothetical protein [Chloroflexota bacterium]
MVATGITTLLFAVILAASASLNRSYAAADAYFATHLQQIRIMDYLARDVRRSFSVTTTADKRSVTCIIPNYIIQPGDPEAVTDPASIGVRRTPVVVGPVYKAVVDYGTRGTRTVTDGVLTTGAATLVSATAAFTVSDVGSPIAGPGIQAGTTIAGRSSATQVTLSKTATAGGSGKWFTVYGDGNRTVTDAKTTNNSTTLTSNTAYFTAADVGRMVCGPTTVAGTKIASVTSSTTAVMSDPANATTPGSALTIGGTVVVYAVANSTITRTENGVLTTIASSTDNLLPETTDWQQSNTEFTTTNVTFQPILNSRGNSWQRSGTAVYATSYLRNKRRGN